MSLNRSLSKKDIQTTSKHMERCSALVIKEMPMKPINKGQAHTKWEQKQRAGSWVWWLTPAIPALWEAEEGRSLEVRSLKAAWPT